MSDTPAATGAAGDREAVRAEIARWVEANWDPDLSLLAWRSLLVDAGWGAPSWPTAWHGRGLPAWSTGVVDDELRRADAIGLPPGVGVNLAGPTILDHGPDGLRARFLRPILTGEESWCQLFSEPGAGSDLAGVTTTAVRDGDEWVVNGQKLWNTSAHHADFGILLARTDWDVPKHRGLTYFVLPMRQPGVEVRPLRQMNDHSSFNEVFLSDARIPADHVVGAEGDGWRVALTTLSYERRFGGMTRTSHPDSGRPAHVEANREADEHFATYVWYPQRAGRVDLAVEHARRAGRLDDSVVRQELAALLSMRSVFRWTAERAQGARSRGRTPGPEGSIGKLALSVLARRAAAVRSVVGGATGLLSGSDGAFDGTIAEVLISVPAQSIAGGTDEIQRNIIGEKVLGLPKEPTSDADVAFRQVVRHA